VVSSLLLDSRPFSCGKAGRASRSVDVAKSASGVAVELLTFCIVHHAQQQLLTGDLTAIVQRFTDDPFEF